MKAYFDVKPISGKFKPNNQDLILAPRTPERAISMTKDRVKAAHHFRKFIRLEPAYLRATSAGHGSRSSCSARRGMSARMGPGNPAEPFDADTEVDSGPLVCWLPLRLRGHLKICGLSLGVPESPSRPVQTVLFENRMRTSSSGSG